MHNNIEFFEKIDVTTPFSDIKKEALEVAQRYFNFLTKAGYSARLDGFDSYKLHLKYKKAIKKSIYDLRKNKLDPYKVIANQPYNKQNYLYIKGRAYRSLRKEPLIFANTKEVKFVKNYKGFLNSISVGDMSRITGNMLSFVKKFFEKYEDGLIKISKVVD